jgi:hypothetical protein
MLDLLHDVRHAVRAPEIDEALRLVDRRLVPRDAERLAGEGEGQYDGGLALRASRRDKRRALPKEWPALIPDPRSPIPARS